MGDSQWGTRPNARRDPRTHVALRVAMTSIDPLHDPVTGERSYQVSEDNRVLNLSRRGICVRCTRPPEIGSRVLLAIHVPGEPRPVEVIGRTCWTRVEFVPGEEGGARAVAAAGIELMGGSRAAMDRYDRTLSEFESDPVATSRALR